MPQFELTAVVMTEGVAKRHATPTQLGAIGASQVDPAFTVQFGSGTSDTYFGPTPGTKPIPGTRHAYQVPFLGFARIACPDVEVDVIHLPLPEYIWTVDLVIELTFSLGVDRPAPPRERFEAFLSRDLESIAWPFLREHIASISTRLGSPMIVAPPKLNHPVRRRSASVRDELNN